jgi:hypothetical protein
VKGAQLLHSGVFKVALWITALDLVTVSVSSSSCHKQTNFASSFKLAPHKQHSVLDRVAGLVTACPTRLSPPYTTATLQQSQYQVFRVFKGFAAFTPGSSMSMHKYSSNFSSPCINIIMTNFTVSSETVRSNAAPREFIKNYSGSSETRCDNVPFDRVIALLYKQKMTMYRLNLETGLAKTRIKISCLQLDHDRPGGGRTGIRL